MIHLDDQIDHLTDWLINLNPRLLLKYPMPRQHPKLQEDQAVNRIRNHDQSPENLMQEHQSAPHRRGHHHQHHLENQDQLVTQLKILNPFQSPVPPDLKPNYQ